MLDVDEYVFTVTDLKQFCYCPRIFYYHACLPDIRPITYKMEAGIRRHETESKHSLRRSMKLEAIENAQREFDIKVSSHVLGLSGQIDELIHFHDRQVPVDYKLAKTPGEHFKLQLTAYAMMAEETFGLPVPVGILYLMRTRKVVEVPVSKKLRQAVQDAVRNMREIATDEAMPESTPQRRRCIECEFRRFCNDV